MALRLMVETHTTTPSGLHLTGQESRAVEGLGELLAPATDAVWLLACDPATGLLHKVRLTAFLFAGLPSVDPEVEGALFTTAGALMVSTGPA